MRKFEFVTKHKNCGLELPRRETPISAGYDMMAVEDKLIPSFFQTTATLEKHILDQKLTNEDLMDLEDRMIENDNYIEKLIEKSTCTIEEMENFTKKTGCKPTLISTGLKAYMNEDEFLGLYARSSSPLKLWLVCGNSVGIIDGDYVDNPGNEGEIMFMAINFSPVPILVKKGEKICQGIFQKFLTTDNDSPRKENRKGGFGSTTK